MTTDLRAAIEALPRAHALRDGCIARAAVLALLDTASPAPAPLDVERLTRAMLACLPESAIVAVRDWDVAAKAIAHEYAALAPSQPEPGR